MTENKNKDVEEIVDEELEDEDMVVILVDDKGKEREFLEIAVIDLDQKFFSVLESTETFDDIEAGDIMIYEIGEDEEGNETLLPIESEETLSKVYEKFNELLMAEDEEEDGDDECECEKIEDNCKCGCKCDCKDDCGDEIE